MKKKQTFLKSRNSMIEQLRSQGISECFARRTGKTTGMALSLIGKAMVTPETAFMIRDHWPTREADMGMFNTVCTLVHRLELEGFHFNRKFRQVAYSLTDKPFKDWL